MPTKIQNLRAVGESLVAKTFACPKCKRARTLCRLPNNFKCANLICDFCGYLAQVTATTVADIINPPPRIVGAAWRPQRDRMNAGIFFPLFIVLITRDRRHGSIFYLSADLQSSRLFKRRTKLRDTARRAGWQGFRYDLASVRSRLVRLHSF